MSKKLFIFDCFGVIVSDVSTIFMDKYLDADKQLYMRKNVYRNVDVGAIQMEDSFVELASLCGLDVEQVKQEWASCEYPLVGTLQVIDKLRKQGHAVALLSNAAVEYIDYLFDKFDLRKYFDRIFVSAAYGYAKPDKELYKLCVDSFTEQFDAVYFTDDNPTNLRDLQQFGVIPILFKNAEDFAAKIGLKN